MDPNLRGNDALALRGLINDLNKADINPDRKSPIVPPEAQAEIAAVLSSVPTPLAVQQTIASPADMGAIIGGTAPSAPAPGVIGKKVFFTGRLAVGKDYVAAQTGSAIFGFADCLYYLATFFFGVNVTSTTNKDLPGMRKFLQNVGQWGRNHVDAENPYSPERAAFIQIIRSLGNNSNSESVFDPRLKVNWNDFGINPAIWVNSMTARCQSFLDENPESRVASTNVRFDTEFKALSEAGWEHWHIVCSPATWAKRLVAKKLDAKSPVLNDVSEKMAQALNHKVQQILSKERIGKRLKVIWNDDEVASPSPRLWTTSEFCAAVASSDGQVVPEESTYAAAAFGGE
jgi:hypothetical protein